MSRSVRTWLIGCAVLIAVASGWLFILRENAVDYQRTVDDALERSRARAVVLREFVDAAFGSVELALRQFDVRPDVTGIVLPDDKEFIQEVLRRTARVTPMSFGLAVANTDGHSVAQPFSGFSHLLARKPGTSGLGLPLCRIFAELLGGSLTIESRPGEGTSVMVVLPPTCLVPPDADTGAVPERAEPQRV